MKPAVFFDRDGVLNIDHGYTYRTEEFQWMDGAKETIRYFNEHGYYVFVVTNQSGIARGYYTEMDVQALHAHMNDELKRNSAHIDAFFYCPHHLDGKIERYRQSCTCRKPGPGMLLDAMQQWPVRREGSFLVGDKRSDVEAARNAGIEGVLYDGENLYAFLRERGKVKVG